jgi:hypothetical protein
MFRSRRRSTGATDAYVGITRLQSAYADVVSRRVWPELGPLFLPDAPVHVDTVTADVIELVGPAALGEFIGTSIEVFEHFQFVVLNTVVRVDGPDRAQGRLWMVELRQERGSGTWSNAFGVYHDDYRLVDGRWRFAERHYQSLARRLGDQPALLFPFPSRHVV